MTFHDMLGKFLATFALVFCGLATLGSGLCGAHCLIQHMTVSRAPHLDLSLESAVVGFVVSFVYGYWTLMLGRYLRDPANRPPDPSADT